MLSNQITFGNDDYTQHMLHNTDTDCVIPSFTPFDTMFLNNNNNNHDSSCNMQHTPQNTQYINNNASFMYPLSHVTVSSDDDAIVLDPSILDSIPMDEEFVRSLEGVSLSSPSSPEPFFTNTPPTDDFIKPDPTPAPVWPAAQYPRKLSAPVGLGELPKLVDFPQDSQVSKKLQLQAELALYMQNQFHSIQFQQQLQVLHDLNRFMKFQEQQMPIMKTQSYDERTFRQATAQYNSPFTRDDAQLSHPNKLHKVRSSEDSYPSPEALASAIKKPRKMVRRSSCSDLHKPPRERKNPSSPRTRSRAPSISSILRDPKVEAMLADTEAKPETAAESHFRLLHEPNVTQRKSYQNENRYLSPNPLTVIARTPEVIKGGDVTVRAVHAGDLTDFPKNVLGEAVIKQSLDESGKAQFVMKCAETTGNQPVKLKFIVRYISNDTLFQEVIYSQGFFISSHTGKKTDAMPAAI